MKFLLRAVLFSFLFLSLTACGRKTPALEGEQQNVGTTSGSQSASLKVPSIRKLATGEEQPPDAQQFPEIMKKETHDWFYGKGLGATMLNVGAIVAFPPYAIYVLGNAGIAMAGYEPVYISDALPDKAQKGVNEVYDLVTAAPGKMTSRIAGEEYQN